MIDTLNKKDCCGCHACMSVCPRNAIKMREDREGFLYPHVDQDLCIGCNQCEKVCPCLNKDQVSPQTPIACYAAKNPNEDIRLQSSSGGLFTLIAEKIIEQGGVVFRARWDDSFGVIHDFAETVEGLARFRGSKYLQSVIGDSYSRAAAFLKEGRKVLFSGTPCQIAGLKGYLGRDDDNLLCVDIACHGVPSPKVWKAHLAYLGRGRKPIAVNMREKNPGWKSYSILYQFEGRKKRNLRVNDPFMCCYLAGLISRPSCHDCPVKPNKGQSDIALADFWGITQLGFPDDDKGTSLVLVNTQKGKTFIDILSFETTGGAYEDIVRYNPSLIESSNPSVERVAFWKDCEEQGIGITIEQYGKHLRPNWNIRLKMFVVNLLHR